MDAIEAVALAMLNGKRAREGWPPLDQIEPGFIDGDEWRLEASDALSAARPLIAAEWQPIETAPPPHNEVVLLYWQDWSGAEYMETARYSTGERLPNGYSNYSQHSWATHWQPLPAPPTAIKETIR